MKKNKRGKKRFFANKIHKDLFWLVFFFALIPVIVTILSLYLFIFNAVAEQLKFPEAIASNIIPAAKNVANTLLIATPVFILAIFILNYKIKMIHKAVGCFDRVVNELEECIKGVDKKRIIIRKGDKFWPMVDKINILLDELNVRR